MENIHSNPHKWCIGLEIPPPIPPLGISCNCVWRNIQLVSWAPHSAKNNQLLAVLFPHYLPSSSRSMNTSPTDKSILATCYNKGDLLGQLSQGWLLFFSTFIHINNINIFALCHLLLYLSPI